MLKKIIGAVVLASSFLFVGCTGGAQIKTSNDAYIHSTVADDKYRNITMVTSPHISQSSKYSIAALRLSVKNGKPSLYQIYISDVEENWRFFHSAYDDKGRLLDFTEVDRQVLSSSSTMEDFALTVSRSYLNNSRAKGIRIKAYGKRADKLFSIPGFVVDGFLRKVDVYLHKQ